MTDRLLEYRSQFPILGTKNYLVSHSLGAMPSATADRLKEYADTWSGKGVTAWADEWWDMPVTAASVIADIINAPAGSVAFHPNVTIMQAIVLSCFEDPGSRRGRNVVVTEELNFPSILYLLRRWTAAHHAELRIVPSDDGIRIDTGRMLEAIDDRTLLVPMSHILFRSAYIQDAAAIIERAHAVGALVVLDAYQSVGVVPVDVRKLGVDILLGGVLKWLCGGPGGAFMYVRPDLLKTLEPRLTGWAAHASPFAFDTGEIDLRTDAFRMLNGTPAIPALYAATEGPRIIREAGVGNIRARSLALTSVLINEAQAQGWSVRTPGRDDERGGTVTLDVPHAREVSRALIHEGILVDYRKGGGIRIAPHFYNTETEVRAAVEAIRSILATRTWESFSGDAGLVT